MTDSPPGFPRLHPLYALSSDYDANPVVSLCIEVSSSWFPILAGWIDVLTDPNMWSGSDADVLNTIEQIALLQERWLFGGRCMPIGSVLEFAGQSVPDGFLMCDGAQLEIDDYPELFAVIGNQFGGDGITNFSLPDARCRTVVSAGGAAGLTPRGLGDSGGSEAHTLVEAEMPRHSHTSPEHSHNSPPHVHVYTVPVTAIGPKNLPPQDIGWQDADLVTGPTAVVIDPTAIDIYDTGGDQAHQNMPPFVVLNRIIKAR